MNKDLFHEVERKLLALILQNGNETLIKVSSEIGEEHFTTTQHKLLFSVFQNLFREGKGIDIVSVCEEIRAGDKYLPHLKKLSISGDFDDVKHNVCILASELLILEVEHSFNIQRSCLVLKENVLREQRMEFLKQQLHKLENGEDIYSLLDEDLTETLKLKTSIENVKSYVPLYEALANAIDDLEKEQRGEIVRIPTPFSDLNYIIKGLENGRLYVLGAEEKIGKSLFVSHIALHSARQKLPVGYLSLEMKSKEHAKRFLVMNAGLTAVDKFDTKKLLEAAKEYSDLPIYFYDVSANIKQLLAVTYKLFYEKNIRLLVVDYLQLIEGEKNVSKVEEVNSIVKALKRLAMDLNLPVVVVASLTIKGMYNRAEKKPRASDLRDSGQISYDADCVLFLWKPDEANKNYLELFVERSRYSGLGAVGLNFDEEHLTFKQVARQEIPQQTRKQFAQDYFNNNLKEMEWKDG